MVVKLIEVNEAKDFKVKFDERFVNRGQVFPQGTNLKDKVNEVIFKKITDGDYTVDEYVPFVAQPLPLDIAKEIKASEFRAKRDGNFNYNNMIFSAESVSVFNSPIALTDQEIIQMLAIEPIETDIVTGTVLDDVTGEERNIYYVIDTLEKVKGLNTAYLMNKITNNNKVNKCKKAKTQTELEEI